MAVTRQLQQGPTWLMRASNFWVNSSSLLLIGLRQRCLLRLKHHPGFATIGAFPEEVGLADVNDLTVSATGDGANMLGVAEGCRVSPLVAEGKGFPLGGERNG